jgi:hypothetical protein
MLGMNDGGYHALKDSTVAAYTNGLDHLLSSIHFHEPGARITLLGPTPYDDLTRAPDFPGGYNAVMQRFGVLDSELAPRSGCSFINLNPPVVALLQKARTLDPLVARLLLPDRVHPDFLPHWVMAETLLKGWNAPSLVSSVTLDAHRLTVSDSQNALIKQVERHQEELRWTETEKSLPLRFNPANAAHALLLQLTDIQQQLNQELLRVTGLEAKLYTLTIDEKTIGEFSADNLSSGINLADYSTPMSSQSEQVGWLVRDRDQACYIHLRMRVRKADTGAGDSKMDFLDAFESSLEDSIYEAATPRPHVFCLAPSRVVPP